MTDDMTLDDARSSAADWHGGQATALYGFASSGIMPCHSVALSEIARARREVVGLISLAALIDGPDDMLPEEAPESMLHNLRQLERWLTENRQPCDDHSMCRCPDRDEG